MVTLNWRDPADVRDGGGGGGGMYHRYILWHRSHFQAFVDLQ